MRLKLPAITQTPVILALARALEVSASDLRVLLATPRILPVDLTQDQAARVVELLEARGLRGELLPVAASLARCPSHPSLTADAMCQTCSKRICPICLDSSGVARCSTCTRALRRGAAWRRGRITMLLLVLAVVCAGALRETRSRAFRTTWRHPLEVQLVLASARPLEPKVLDAWAGTVVALDGWFERERLRHGLALEHPIRLHLATPVTAASLPTPPADEADWLSRARRALTFRRELEALVERAHPAHADITLLVALEPPAGVAGWVEGTAEAGGTLGYVRGVEGDVDLHLEAQIVAHELLHCLGAADGYDAEGHALNPEGLAEPEASPRFPQRFAEVMAGELAEGPGRGRLPAGLEELQLGPVTAAAIHWP